jgi:hypothetical protein
MNKKKSAPNKAETIEKIEEPNHPRSTLLHRHT